MDENFECNIQINVKNGRKMSENERRPSSRKRENSKLSSKNESKSKKSSKNNTSNKNEADNCATNDSFTNNLSVNNLVINERRHTNVNSSNNRTRNGQNSGESRKNNNNSESSCSSSIPIPIASSHNSSRNRSSYLDENSYEINFRQDQTNSRDYEENYGYSNNSIREDHAENHIRNQDTYMNSFDQIRNYNNLQYPPTSIRDTFIDPIPALNHGFNDSFPQIFRPLENQINPNLTFQNFHYTGPRFVYETNTQFATTNNFSFNPEPTQPSMNTNQNMLAPRSYHNSNQSLGYEQNYPLQPPTTQANLITLHPNHDLPRINRGPDNGIESYQLNQSLAQNPNFLNAGLTRNDESAKSLDSWQNRNNAMQQPHLPLLNRLHNERKNLESPPTSQPRRSFFGGGHTPKISRQESQSLIDKQQNTSVKRQDSNRTNSSKNTTARKSPLTIQVDINPVIPGQFTPKSHSIDIPLDRPKSPRSSSRRDRHHSSKSYRINTENFKINEIDKASLSSVSTNNKRDTVVENNSNNMLGRSYSAIHTNSKTTTNNTNSLDVKTATTNLDTTLNQMHISHYESKNSSSNGLISSDKCTNYCNMLKSVNRSNASESEKPVRNANSQSQIDQRFQTLDMASTRQAAYKKHHSLKGKQSLINTKMNNLGQNNSLFMPRYSSIFNQANHSTNSNMANSLTGQSISVTNQMPTYYPGPTNSINYVEQNHTIYQNEYLKNRMSKEQPILETTSSHRSNKKSISPLNSSQNPSEKKFLNHQDSNIMREKKSNKSKGKDSRNTIYSYDPANSTKNTNSFEKCDKDRPRLAGSLPASFLIKRDSLETATDTRASNTERGSNRVSMGKKLNDEIKGGISSSSSGA